jgi:hypothetical protein
MESKDNADVVADGDEVSEIPDDMQDLKDGLEKGLQGFVTFCRDLGKKSGHSVELAIKFSIEKLKP